MNRSLILTIIGPDRTGLVEAVASKVSTHGGNWLESRMARLAGQFAGILRVRVIDQQAESLIAALRELRSEGLTVTVESVEDSASPAGVRHVRLHLIGQDHPGIVHDLSRALAACGVNIEELETETASAPMSGESLFEATATLGVPASMTTDQLRTQLDEVAEQMMVDITVEDEAV